MANENYFDIFICHNSEDTNQVREISSQLKNLDLPLGLMSGNGAIA